MRSLATIVASAVVAGCGSLGFEAEVLNREPFDPPPIYGSWWAATAECSRRSGDMARVTWFLATGIRGDGASAWGRWSEPHEIILVKGYEGSEVVVRHEMLHDLLGGDRAHETSAWNECDLIPR